MNWKQKLNQIRILAAKLGNVLTKEERMTIREVLYKIENKERLTKTQRKRRLNFLIGLLKTLYNKEKYQDSDQYDLDYFGIRDLEHLFNTIDHDDYYKPILTKSAFLNNYEE